MGLIDIKKKKDNIETKKNRKYFLKKEEYIDDVSYIRAINHLNIGPWHQYDILLASQGYGWDFMIKWADYMADADLDNLSQVTTGDLGEEEKEITESYVRNNKKCFNLSELATEKGVLSIAGISKVLGAPMKIVWINQTNTLRFFSIIDNETLIRKYAETVVRRTFGTENAMKLGKPIPDK